MFPLIFVSSAYVPVSALLWTGGILVVFATLSSRRFARL